MAFTAPQYRAPMLSASTELRACASALPRSTR
jgi:hypothetical protein